MQPYRDLAGVKVKASGQCSLRTQNCIASLLCAMMCRLELVLCVHGGAKVTKLSGRKNRKAADITTGQVMLSG